MEHDEQAALIEWVNWSKHSIPELELLFAIPNGGKRHVVTAMRLQKEGAKAGVFDLMLPVARRGYHGMFIEMKYGKNGLSESQQEFKKLVEAEGYLTLICWNWEEAKEGLLKYLKR